MLGFVHSISVHCNWVLLVWVFLMVACICWSLGGLFLLIGGASYSSSSSDGSWWPRNLAPSFPAIGFQHSEWWKLSLLLFQGPSHLWISRGGGLIFNPWFCLGWFTVDLAMVCSCYVSFRQEGGGLHRMDLHHLVGNDDGSLVNQEVISSLIVLWVLMVAFLHLWEGSWRLMKMLPLEIKAW